jgi:hypothetical protein
MANVTVCPKCSSEKTARNFLYGSKPASIIAFLFGLMLVVQDPSNWLGWSFLIAGIVAFPQKKHKCNECGFKWI